MTLWVLHTRVHPLCQGKLRNTDSSARGVTGFRVTMNKDLLMNKEQRKYLLGDALWVKLIKGINKGNLHYSLLESSWNYVSFRVFEDVLIKFLGEGRIFVPFNVNKKAISCQWHFMILVLTKLTVFFHHSSQKAAWRKLFLEKSPI